MPRRTLTAFLISLYLWTPFLNIIPTPSFLPSPSAPSQNYGTTSLPPGTVTDIRPSPKLVQSQDFDYNIQTRMVSAPSGCAGTQGCLTWTTPQGNLTFSKEYPFAMSYAYFGAKNNTAVSLAAFDVTEGKHGILRPGVSTVTTTAATYDVNTTELSSGPNTPRGYLDVKYDFGSTPFKATATYRSVVASSFNIRWLVAGYDYVTDPITNATRQMSSLPTDTNATIGPRPAVTLTDAPTSRGHRTLINVHDAGTATFVYGHLRLFLGNGNAAHYDAVAAVFPTNASRIDPTLVQMSANTCSYVCSGGTTTVQFPSGVAANDMLVVTIVTDNSNILIVSDSLGTKIAQAVQATTSSCGNGLSCQADIYWGLFPSSSPDTVTVSDGASDRALRVQIWEFSGVGAIGNTVSCAPTCGSVFYPADSVLIATAMDAYGPGPGFAWYQYAASGVAGSELEIAANQGSTSFPFSTAIDHVESGAALVGVVPQSATPPWGQPGLSPYESYVNNAMVYVSMGNGLVSVEQPTFYLPGRDLAVAPALFYEEPGAFRGSGSSPNQYDNFSATNLGYGWSLNIPWLGAYDVHLAGGQTYPYSWNGGTDMQVHGPVDFEVTSTGSDGVCPCRLLLPSGISYYFDQYKHLTAETDTTNNNVVQFGYGTNGLLSTIVDSVGRVTSFAYNGAQLLAIIAPGNRIWILGYSGNDLVTVQNPVGDVERFTYMSNNPWLLNSVTYAAGGTVRLVYGSEPVFGGTSYVVTLRYTQNSAMSITQSDSISYVFDNGVLASASMTEADGSGTIQGYVKDYYSPSTGVAKSYSQDPTGTTTRIVEEDFTDNRLASAEVESGTGIVLARSTFSYDDWGNVIHTKDNSGHETWLSYDGASSYNSFTNPNCSTSGFYSNPTIAGVHSLLVGVCTFQDAAHSVQQETFNEYNGNAELTERKVAHDGGYVYTDYTYDSYGNVLSVRDANGNYFYYGYSPAYANAYLTKQSLVASGQNITTYHTYDFNTGFMTSTTDPRGYTTVTTYDALGRVLTNTYPAVNGISSVESVSYNDPFGPVTITDPRGNQTKEYLDGLGRMIAVQRMNGSSVYSTTYYTNNWLDRVAQVTDARGYTFSFAYDQAGRLTKESFPDGTAVTASYDDTNNVVTTKDQDGREAVSTYDWNGRLLSVQKFSTSTQSYLTSYAYDGVGNLVSVTNGDGQTTSYTYDDLNRLARTTTPDRNATMYAYDNVGNLVSKTTPNGATIGYTYDQAHRLVGTNYPDGTFTDVSYDQDGNVVAVASTLSGSTADAYSYDPLDRLSSSTVSVSGVAYTTTYAYDKAGNLVEIQYPDGLVVPMTYDSVNRLKKVGNYASFAYNQDDGVTTITFGDAEVQSYSYDSRDRPTTIQDVSGNKKLLSLAYAYDGASNVVSVNNDHFSYDGISRLTSAKGPGGNVTYTYDGAGNMLSSGSKSGQTVYDKCGYYPNSLSGAVVVQCGTDKDGNIVSKTGGWAYSYNFEDEMTVAKVNGAAVQTNVYDGIGNRVEKREIDTTVFTYLGVNLLFEKDLTTGATTDHIYGDGMQLAKVTGGTTYYYHEDQVGSNRLVTYTDSRGRVSTQFSSGYTAYGSDYHPKGSETFQYTDRMLDSATGLYYFNARFYDPSTMRFMTEDPVAGDTAIPSSLNLYAYAGDNPLSNVDPTGTLFLAPAIDPWQWFFSLENQVRGYLGLPSCNAGCQEIQMDRYRLIAPFIGMYTGGEGDIPVVQQRIASLTAEQFDVIVRSQPITEYRATFVQARLAVELGGSMRRVRTETLLGHRYYDIKAPNLLGELKFGRDPLNPSELEKDVAMLKSGQNVHYYLVDDPVNPVESRKARIGAMNKLDALGIPYTPFTWDEFLRWIEIPD